MNARPTALNSQHGFIAMAAALLLGVAIVAILLGNLSARQHEVNNEARTLKALKEAKQAVLGYITLDSPASNDLKEDSNLIPGSLPCPAASPDGITRVSDYTGTYCRFGALAYRLPSTNFLAGFLTDSANEKLWYSVSRGFSTNETSPINSDTVPTLRIDGREDYVAVIIAPEAALPGQSRDNPGDRSAYLDDANSTAGPYFTTGAGLSRESFNDRLVGITRAEWEAAISPRVANEILARLIDYQKANFGHLPFPAQWTATPTRSMMQAGVPQGMLPVADLWPVPPEPPTPPTPQSIAQQKKDWLPSNEWYRFVYYAVAPAMVTGASRDCAVHECLTVSRNGTVIDDVKAVLILSGAKLGSQSRPSADLEDYIENPSNRDGNAMFVSEAVTPTANDRIYILR